jgi:hypothetical protein
MLTKQQQGFFMKNKKYLIFLFVLLAFTVVFGYVLNGGANKKHVSVERSPIVINIQESMNANEDDLENEDDTN